MPPKPRFRDSFAVDILQNLLRLSNNGKTQLYRHHLMTECVWYACDMCLEFQRKSDGSLTTEWIEHIVAEVSEAITMIVANDFGETDKQMAIQKVKDLMRLPASHLQEKVDKYYSSY